MFKRKQRVADEVKSPEQLRYENAIKTQLYYEPVVKTFYPSEYEEFLKSMGEKPVGSVVLFKEFPPLVLPNGEILFTYGVLK